ncbi:MAG: tRNA uridine-5-carboxymethylaminomethyl(34) synthesis enzyme MnmG, partial [candidate division Zixibacteria bacterium]|nr:tRNA uridine-5-carboxymethylaminomethyl(34) synthesis enzyme MnmG [candidate division Zixibacteria bacterium]
MIIYKEEYEVIVVGAGHAGCEAALATSRMGHKTLLLTMNKEVIAQMSCNPAVGGQAKGHLVKEIDVLGGEIGLNTDKTAVQLKVLNKRKGPAVWSTRAQCDRTAYRIAMRQVLEGQPNLWVKQGNTIEVLVEKNKVKGVLTETGTVYSGKIVILCVGTFLNGLIHIGLTNFPAGRMGEFPARGITENLIKLGFEAGRLKTGTPPRLDGKTIDFEKTEIQWGDENPTPFSLRTNKLSFKHLPCFLTYTNSDTHNFILKNLDRSPLYSGVIKGIGPRYCPSIEDKVVRFKEKPRHQLFLEPEGYNTNEYYLNGFATSLPEDVQLSALRTVPGLEKVEMARPGYAIEYDFFPPIQLKNSLETKLIENLFFAGQINGTSGYEEAAAQGIMAGINAGLKLEAREPFILDRSQAYIGVLIDDLITKGTKEPYRMFTSRAEYRLLLREDNADQRLIEYGHKFGLIDKEIYSRVKTKMKNMEKERERLKRTYAKFSFFNIGSDNDKRISLADALKITGINYENLAKVDKASQDVPPDVASQVELATKYEGYIKRQEEEVTKFRRLENMAIPQDFDYQGVSGFKKEALEKLSKVKPVSVGQASRISGVSPGDIAVLL